MIFKIKGLNLEAIIGFWPEEREKKQPVIINVTYEIDTDEAVKHDDVDYSVDYNGLVEEIIDKIPATEFNLLEKLTEYVKEIVMSREQIKWAEIEVIKPYAPLRFTDSISATIKSAR